MLRSIRQRARDFAALESAGGLVMIAAALVAVFLTNSPFASSYQHVLELSVQGFSLVDFVKDVLMVLFFFAVGMELKIEMREGVLAAKGQKILPLFAAIGGIAVPALIYGVVTRAHADLQVGWAIPTATDIAFALCVLRLAGPAIPPPAKTFLLAIAIYDDLAAILIIALFYSSGMALVSLAMVAVLLCALAALNRFHCCSIIVYAALAIALWFALHHAHIHPTVAGVATGIAIPLRRGDGTPLLAPLLHRIHPFIAFFVLPLFAFVSAGVSFAGLQLEDLLATLPLGIMLALVIGKPLGILLGSGMCTGLGLARLPAGVPWRMVVGIGLLAGIGFTMSFFIGDLAFSAGESHTGVTLGILAGSLISAGLGLLYLRLARRA